MDLDEKLESARQRAQNYGNKRGLKETADDYVKGVYAQLYPDAPDGTVADKDAWVRRQSAYKDAIIEKQGRYADFAAAELYMKLLFAELDKYRTDKSYDKFLDKAHT